MDTPAYKEKSEKAKANRRAAELHTGGSRPHAAALADLTQWAVKEKKAPESVTMHDVFQHTHKRRKDGSFIDDRAKETDAAYREALSRAQSSAAKDVGETTPARTPSSMAARNDLFVDTVGGFKKGRMYGVCSLAPLHMATQSFPPTPPPSAAPANDDVRSQLVQLHETVSSLRKKIATYFLPPSTAAGPSSVGHLSFNPAAPLVPPPTVTTLLDLMSPEQLRLLSDNVFDGLPRYIVEQYYRRSQEGVPPPDDRTPPPS
ncbi:uncharacterized protein M6B38_161705 [Iris pallida]|uniref:Uncharacterized protein n=1 Tax=Iris pallida TaxID=29817 RepID=A0AAX6F009_IRIPA|nr:uncharacterized protein M6B38_161705 [Iris pallida]